MSSIEHTHLLVGLSKPLDYLNLGTVYCNTGIMASTSGWVRWFLWSPSNSQDLRHYRLYPQTNTSLAVNLFIYLGFYIAFNTVQVISRRLVGRAEETSTYSSSGFCTVNCQPTQATTSFPTWGHAGNRTPASEVGGESVTTLPPWPRL